MKPVIEHNLDVVIPAFVTALGRATSKAALTKGFAKAKQRSMQSIRMSQDVATRKPFAPLKSGEARTPMILTGNMLNSFAVRVSSEGGLFENTAPYSAFQNNLRRFANSEVILGDIIASAEQELERGSTFTA